MADVIRIGVFPLHSFPISLRHSQQGWESIPSLYLKPLDPRSSRG